MPPSIKFIFAKIITSKWVHAYMALSEGLHNQKTFLVDVHIEVADDEWQLNKEYF